MTVSQPPQQVCLLRKAISIPTGHGTGQLGKGELVTVVSSHGEECTISLLMDSSQVFTCQEKNLKTVPYEIVKFVLPVIPCSRRYDAFLRLDKELLTLSPGSHVNVNRGRPGTKLVAELKYRGEIKDRLGVWFGLKLLGMAAGCGDCDGSIKGVYYMDRHSPNSILFATVDELSIRNSTDSARDSTLSLLSNMGDMKDSSNSKLSNDSASNKLSKTLPAKVRRSTSKASEVMSEYSEGDPVVILKNRLPAEPGTVRVVFQDAKKRWLLGVELDSRVGDSDGTYKGRQMFQCEPGFGVFCSPTEAMPKHYCNYQRVQSPSHSRSSSYSDTLPTSNHIQPVSTLPAATNSTSSSARTPSSVNPSSSTARAPPSNNPISSTALTPPSNNPITSPKTYANCISSRATGVSATTNPSLCPTDITLPPPSYTDSFKSYPPLTRPPQSPALNRSKSPKLDFEQAFRMRSPTPTQTTDLVKSLTTLALVGGASMEGSLDLQRGTSPAPAPPPDTPDPPPEVDPSLEVGSMVQVNKAGTVHYGVIGWIGSLPNKRHVCAGLELEEEISPPGNSGVYEGVRYFTCPPFRALFCYLHDCSKDKRFDEMPVLSEVKQYFGPHESYVIPGKVDPPKCLNSQLVGCNRGIQGNRNSCYLDSTLYAMFAFNNTMDYMLTGPVSTPTKESIRKLLLEAVVNPLREEGFVSAAHMHTLRDLLSSGSALAGLQNEEKEPEELLNVLFSEIFNIKPLLSFRDGLTGEISHVNLCQILLERDPNSSPMPCTQDLLTRYFVSQDLYFHSQPELLLLQVPRSGKDFKLYDTVLPSPELQLGGLCGGVWGKCYICNRKPFFKCSQCYLNQDFKSRYSAVPYCESCCALVHSHPDRANHSPQHATNPTRGMKMVLSAVLCIHTSHYVTYCRVRSGHCAKPAVKSGHRANPTLQSGGHVTVPDTRIATLPRPSATLNKDPAMTALPGPLLPETSTGIEPGTSGQVPGPSSSSSGPSSTSEGSESESLDSGYCWVFFDSMSDREGGVGGYNIPKVEECPMLEEWLQDPAKLIHEKDRAPLFVKRLISDALLCFYVRENS